jgi:hypothetical protein
MATGPTTSLRHRTPEEKAQDQKAVERVKLGFFTDSLIEELINHIVTELLLIQPSDLRDWEEEPDEWEKREELASEDFEFAARPCAEKLLLDISLKYKELAANRLSVMLQTVTGKQHHSSLIQD